MQFIQDFFYITSTYAYVSIHSNFTYANFHTSNLHQLVVPSDPGFLLAGELLGWDYHLTTH